MGLASVSGHEDLFIYPIRLKWVLHICTSGPVNGYPGSNFNLTCESRFTNLQKGVSFEGRFNHALSSPIARAFTSVVVYIRARHFRKSRTRVV